MTNDSQSRFKTEQEAFWAGEFGDEYVGRNVGAGLVASNVALFGEALRRARGLGSCIEFGANIGLNLIALKTLFPSMEQHAIEINCAAVWRLAQVVPRENVFQTSILDFTPSREWDLVLIKGVLIHIDPDSLPAVYDKLYAASGRYVMVCEYYNPAPVMVPYRGHGNRLFKRDFAGEMLDRFSSLQLVDYGFSYRRDPNFPQDDTTWFLLEKRG
jgi:spore coat polysaccharide biosynthesis protein SpsF